MVDREKILAFKCDGVGCGWSLFPFLQRIPVVSLAGVGMGRRFPCAFKPENRFRFCELENNDGDDSLRNAHRGDLRNEKIFLPRDFLAAGKPQFERLVGRESFWK